MRYAIALVLVLITSPAWAAIAEVGGGTQRATKETGSVASTTLAFPGNVTSGNLMVLLGMANNSIASVGVTDTLGSTWSCLSGSFSVDRLYICYAKAPSTGANTVTLTPSANASLTFWIDEFTGQHATSPLDVNGGISTGTSTSPADSLTTTVANALVLGVMQKQCGGCTGAESITPAGGYTQIGEEEDATSPLSGSAVFQVVTTAQAYSVSWTIGTSRTWGAYTASFVPAPVSGCPAILGGGIGCGGLISSGEPGDDVRPQPRHAMKRAADPAGQPTRQRGRERDALDVEAAMREEVADLADGELAHRRIERIVPREVVDQDGSPGFREAPHGLSDEGSVSIAEDRREDRRSDHDIVGLKAQFGRVADEHTNTREQMRGPRGMVDPQLVQRDVLGREPPTDEVRDVAPTRSADLEQGSGREGRQRAQEAVEGVIAPPMFFPIRVGAHGSVNISHLSVWRNRTHGLCP